MNNHYKAVLKEADKIIKQKKVKISFSKIIDNLSVELLPPKYQEEFKKELIKIKKESPHLWELDNYLDIQSTDFYKYYDFFDLCCYLEQLEFLYACYPQEKEKLKKLFDSKNVFQKIEAMAETLKHYLTSHDDLIDYDTLYKKVDFNLRLSEGV